MQEIKSYLCDKHSKITKGDLERNKEKMKQEWNINATIEILFRRTENSKKLAIKGGNTFLKTKIVTKEF